mgnify:FL=1
MSCGDMYNLRPYPEEKLAPYREWFWLPRDCMASLQAQAARRPYPDEDEEEVLQRISERYGQLSLSGHEDGARVCWYDDQLGAFHLLLNERKR